MDDSERLATIIMDKVMEAASKIIKEEFAKYKIKLNTGCGDTIRYMEGKIFLNPYKKEK